MGDDSSDPIDHARTTRQHAGETMTNGANGPGLIIMALGVMAMVFGLAALASGAAAAGWVAAVIAVVAFVVGGTWLFVTHRRVRRQEIDWAREHSPVEAPPPVS
jgi:tetrahydromethanopterin S-methyltransferase subunit C